MRGDPSHRAERQHAVVSLDFVWEEQRLILETDGWGAHGTRRAFERDRRRDQRLMLAGWRVVRCPSLQVLDEHIEVGAVIAGLLAQT